jgi:hypothetical protein
MSVGFSHLNDAELETLHKSLHTDVANPAVLEAHHSVTTEILARGLEHGHEDDQWNRAVVELEVEDQIPVAKAISEMPADIAEQVIESLGNPEFVKKTTLLTVDGYTLKFDAFEKSEEVEIRLNETQKMLYETLEAVVERVGSFDQGTGANGAHYMEENPFVEEGMVCANCVFYEGGQGCEIVTGLIDPMALCKFWIIPEDLLTSVSKHRAGQHDQSSHGSWAPDTVLNEKDTQGKYSDEANAEASKLRKTVEEYEPELTERMMKLTAENGGRLEGLEYRLKTEESLARKIDKEAKQDFGGDTKKASEKISDAVRYTSVIDVANYSDGVQATLKGLEDAGYTVDPKRIKNFWDTGDDYQGINAKVRHPSGFEFELQFHTPESLKAKEQTHPHYEEFRTAEDAKTKVKIFRRMTRIARNISIPVGVLAVGTLTNKPLIIGSQEILFKSTAILRFRGGGANV